VKLFKIDVNTIQTLQFINRDVRIDNIVFGSEILEYNRLDCFIEIFLVVVLGTRKDYTFYGIYGVIVFLCHDTCLLLLKILRPNFRPLRWLRPSRTKEFDLPGSYHFLKCITVKYLELDLFKGESKQTLLVRSARDRKLFTTLLWSNGTYW